MQKSNAGRELSAHFSLIYMQIIGELRLYLHIFAGLYPVYIQILYLCVFPVHVLPIKVRRYAFPLYAHSLKRR